jgi:hypothetical protein
MFAFLHQHKTFSIILYQLHDKFIGKRWEKKRGEQNEREDVLRFERERG